MNLKTAFLTALASPPAISETLQNDSFLGTIRSENAILPPQLVSLLSTGDFSVTPPYSYDLHALGCYLLLYTKKGAGKISLRNEVYSLLPDTLLFLHCTERFRIDIAAESWEYEMCFLNGEPLSYFYDSLSEKSLKSHGQQIPLLSVLPYTEASLKLYRLLHSSPTLSKRELLQLSLLCQELLGDFLLEDTEENEQSTKIPSYLVQIKSLFDDSFQDYYTLDELQNRFGVSKYRLCREFHTYYGDSPLQYLNKKRIQVAGHLLLTTSAKIHEIGSQVGIDNTNHFISLFKKYTGETPSTYKQRMT